MRKQVLITMSIAICIVITGCSDSPSKSSLAKEIDNHLELDKESMQCMKLRGGGFPINVDEEMFTKDSFVTGLVKSGLVTGKAVTLNQGMMFQEINAIELSLTEKGQKAELIDSENRICWGRKGVAEVTQWTEPGQGTNTQQIIVYYKWKIVDSPNWVDKENFADIKGMSEPLEAKAVMTKMNDGWKVEVTN